MYQSLSLSAMTKYSLSKPSLCHPPPTYTCTVTGNSPTEHYHCSKHYQRSFSRERARACTCTRENEGASKRKSEGAGEGESEGGTFVCVSHPAPYVHTHRPRAAAAAFARAATSDVTSAPPPTSGNAPPIMPNWFVPSGLLWLPNTHTHIHTHAHTNKHHTHKHTYTHTILSSFSDMDLSFVQCSLPMGTNIWTRAHIPI